MLEEYLAMEWPRWYWDTWNQIGIHDHIGVIGSYFISFILGAVMYKAVSGFYPWEDFDNIFKNEVTAPASSQL